MLGKKKILLVLTEISVARPTFASAIAIEYMLLRVHKLGYHRVNSVNLRQLLTTDDMAQRKVVRVFEFRCHPGTLKETDFWPLGVFCKLP